MCEQESFVCHLPNNAETTKCEDREGYQPDKALMISRISVELEQTYPEYPVLSISESASHSTNQPRGNYETYPTP